MKLTSINNILKIIGLVLLVIVEDEEPSEIILMSRKKFLFLYNKTHIEEGE